MKPPLPKLVRITIFVGAPLVVVLTAASVAAGGPAFGPLTAFPLVFLLGYAVRDVDVRSGEASTSA